MSFWPRLSERSGIARGMRIASAASPARIGRRATRGRTSTSPGPPAACRWRPRTRSELMCGPAIASVADSSVIAASTATTTEIAAIRPMVGHQRDAGDREGEQGDGDGPAGEGDRAAGGRDRPGDRLVQLHAFPESSEVARDDEQRVVDPYAQADHRGQGRRHGRDGHRMAEDVDDRQRGREGHDRVEDGQHHRDHGPEGEREDHHRGEDPDQLARLGRRLGDLLPELSAGLDLDARRLRRLLRVVDDGTK